MIVLSLSFAAVSIFFAFIVMGLDKVRAMTISKFFYYSYLVMIYFPALFVYKEGISPYRETYLLATTSVLFLVPLGILLIRESLCGSNAADMTYFYSPVVYEHDRNGTKIAVLLLFFFGLGILLIYLYVTPSVPLFDAILKSKDYQSLAEAREQTFKLIQIPVLIYLFSSTKGLIFPFVVLITYLIWRSTKETFWRVFFLLTLLTALFYAGLTLAKSPVAAIFLMVVLAYYYERKGKLPFSKIILFGLIIFAFPVFVIMTIQPWTEEQSVLMRFFLTFQGIGRRLFWAPAWTLYKYFEIFPHHVEFLGGRSIGIFSKIVGIPYFSVENFVYLFLKPGAEILSGSENACFVGNLYADFGLVGVLLGSFFVGMLLEGCHQFLLSKPKTPVYLASYIFLIFAFWLLLNSNLFVVLNTHGLIWVFLLAFLVRLLPEFIESVGIKARVLRASTR